MSRARWLHRSPDLTQRNFVFVEGDLREILQNAQPTVSLAEILCLMKNVFGKCNACLRAEGNNFQKHLLQISYVKV